MRAKAGRRLIHPVRVAAVAFENPENYNHRALLLHETSRRGADPLPTEIRGEAPRRATRQRSLVPSLSLPLHSRTNSHHAGSTNSSKTPSFLNLRDKPPTDARPPCPKQQRRRQPRLPHHLDRARDLLADRDPPRRLAGLHLRDGHRRHARGRDAVSQGEERRPRAVLAGGPAWVRPRGLHQPRGD